LHNLFLRLEQVKLELFHIVDGTWMARVISGVVLRHACGQVDRFRWLELLKACIEDTLGRTTTLEQQIGIALAILDAGGVSGY